MACFSVKERVKFQQRTWFAPKSLMIWHSKNLPGYALTEHQIMEHYDPTDEAYTRGHAENTRFSIKYHVDRTEHQETLDYFKAIGPTPKTPEVVSNRSQCKSGLRGKSVRIQVVHDDEDQRQFTRGVR